MPNHPYGMNSAPVLQSIVTGFGIFGAFEQAEAIRAQAGYESEALKWNARMAQLEALSAIRAGERESKEHQLAVLGLMGRQRAALAAQGIDISTGTALQLQEDTARAGAIDAAAIRSNAYMAALSKRSQAAAYRTEAALRRAAGGYRAAGLVLTAGLEGVRESLRYYVPRKKEEEVPIAPIYVPRSQPYNPQKSF